MTPTSRDTDADVAVPVDAPPEIPGLRFRRFRDDSDYAALADLISTANLVDRIDEIPDAANLKFQYEHASEIDPRLDIVFAEVDGGLIGYGDADRTVREGVSVYRTGGTVHPAWRRRGLGRALLRTNERRLRELAAGRDDPGGRVFGSWIDDLQGGAIQLLEAEGYHPVRYFFGMRRPHLGDLPEAPLPDGLEVRPVRVEDHRAIYDADVEAFLDHWGSRERTEEDFVSMFGMPNVDTTLWRVAWDGDQVAGSVMPAIWRTENERLGIRRAWLEHISVRRSWRRRGVARALIVSALEGLREVGMEDAMLGVDAENPTGALGLYESLGFVVKDRGTSWRKDWA